MIVLRSSNFCPKTTDAECSVHDAATDNRQLSSELTRRCELYGQRGESRMTTVLCLFKHATAKAERVILSSKMSSVDGGKVMPLP